MWIGGGVGIAPFISWAKNLIKQPNNDLTVDIYYCVNYPSEATHSAVFEELQKVMPSVRFNLICSDVQGFIKLGNIENIDIKCIFLCGPKEMRKALISESKSLNISRKSIHFEDFNFA